MKIKEGGQDENPEMRMMKQWKRIVSLMLTFVLVLSFVSFAPAQLFRTAIIGASAVASYPANLSVKTTRAVNLLDGPGVGNNAKYTLPENTMLTVKELHKDSSDNYWYEVSFYGMTLYVDATATTMVAHLTGDVTATDLMTPAALGLNQGFPLCGTVKSTLNQLGTIYAGVHYNSNVNEAPALYTTDDVNGYSYTIDDSDLDYYLHFNKLTRGSYTFLLTVEAISYYIDDKGALVTSVQEVVLDQKPLIVTDVNNPNTIIAKGIDVSVHQGTINWASVAPQIDFAILRIGWEYTLDTQFKNNAAGCNKNNVPFGVYIYSYAENESEAIREAEFVINALKDYDIDLPVFFDIEDECQANLGATAIQNITKAFCDTIREAGYEPGLYTFLSWFNSYFGGSYYNSLPKWVAQISSSCSYTKGLTMWQYSWTGRFSGISGDVDCNYYYGEFPGKNSDSSYLGKCTYYPSNMIAVANQNCNVRQYPSTDYSVQSTLTAGTQVHVTGLYSNASGYYWYQVDQDGTTGYVSADYLDYETFLYDDISVMNPTMENLALNSGYSLKGMLRSRYNNLYSVNAKVFNGEDTLSTPVLTSSADVMAKKYSMYHSDVCDGMIFSDLDTGYYTYELSATVRNYCVNEAGNRAYMQKEMVVWTKPFTVGSATITPPASMSCDHNIVVDKGYAATCTTDGLSDGSHCTKCGVVMSSQTVIKAPGHSYSAETVPANCLDKEHIIYTCTACGDTYTDYVGTSLGNHGYVDGLCIYCGAEDPDAVCKHLTHGKDGICTECMEQVGHVYVDGVCAVCGKAPAIAPLRPSVSFEDMVILNIYFTVTDLEDTPLEDMGLLTWSTPPTDGTIHNAQKVIPGAVSNGTEYMVHSEGITAKKIGDIVYFRIYAKLADGSYVYSSLMSTSPKAYALGRIKNSTNANLRAACVAMLNYGAEAQLYFSYKPYALMNSGLTEEQKAMAKPYDASMVQSLPTVDTQKTAKIVNTGGFTKLSPTVSFDEAFSINFYFTPAHTVDGGLTLYYWSAQDYNALQELNLSNATGSVSMVTVDGSGVYWGSMTGIAAKEIDQEAYFVGVYQSGGLTYTTGVRVYSLGSYCKTVAAKESSAMKDLAAATAVYGYYCKQYFS